MVKRMFLMGVVVFLLAGCAAPTLAPTAPPVVAPTVVVPVNTAVPTMTEMATATPVASPTVALTATEPVATASVPAETPATAVSPVPTGQSTQGAAVPVTGGAAYTVLVGAEDTNQGANVESFFPADLRIHTGDTVVWKQNSYEIHTVSFLAGATLPDFVVPVPGQPMGAMMVNPQAGFPAGPQNGQYDGTTFVNSGIMGKEQGQIPTFQLTFTRPGTYEYICMIHGATMKASITVVAPTETISSPQDVQQQVDQAVSQQMAQAKDLMSAAEAKVPADQTNADGTTTHHILVGYGQGSFDLMAFFPKKVTVRPGDTVVWTFAAENMAPHTITFLNGAEEPALIVPNPQPNAQPLLLLNPALLLPQNTGQPVTNQGVYSSGFIDPQMPGPHEYSVKIGAGASGDLAYECLLHDASGMKGTLTVTK